MIEESTFRRYITESWEWWKPIWKSDRNGFMRFKGERAIYYKNMRLVACDVSLTLHRQDIERNNGIK